MIRKAVLLLICVGGMLQVSAQQEFFIFIQHEKNQPFYVRMGERTFSSSALGHIILSRLKDSAYKLSVGFPNNQFPEQDYNIQLNKKDRGFELKNLPEKGWNLFDLHSMELIAPVKAPQGNSGGVAFIKRNDDFARLMSSVVNDTAVLYAAAAVEKKPAPVVAKKTETDGTQLNKDSKKTDTDSTALAAVTRKEGELIENPKKTEESSNAEVNNSKKTESATDVVKKSETTSTEQINPVKKPETTSTEQVNPVKKPDSVLADLTSSKKTDSVLANDVANNVQKKTESSIKEPSKTDSAKKVTPEPINETVFNPPAVPVIAVVKQYASDSGYHMLMVDDKDSVNIFIPGEEKGVAKTDKPVKSGEEKGGTKNNDPDKNANTDKKTDDKIADKPVAITPVPEKQVLAENKPVKEESKSTNPDKQVNADNKSAVLDSKSVKSNSDNKVGSPDKPATDKSVVPDSKSTNPDNKTANPANAADDTTKKPSKLVMVNSDCRSTANSNDVDKLRVRLIQEKDAESRISAARKIFKTKCFTASQIKALSELFPYDDQKYSFLEASYPFVYDTSNFKELVSLLDDPTYVSRFRKMVRLD